MPNEIHSPFKRGPNHFKSIYFKLSINTKLYKYLKIKLLRIFYKIINMEELVVEAILKIQIKFKILAIVETNRITIIKKDPTEILLMLKKNELKLILNFQKLKNCLNIIFHLILLIISNNSCFYKILKFII